MYSPTLGRFLQTDPAGTVGGANLYAYVGNDPLNRISSTGLASDSPLPPEESNSNLPSPFRYTAPGESFLRYESDNPNFSRIDQMER